MYYIGDYVLANTWFLKKCMSIIYLLTMPLTNYRKLVAIGGHICEYVLTAQNSQNKWFTPTASILVFFYVQPKHYFSTVNFLLLLSWYLDLK